MTSHQTIEVMPGRCIGSGNCVELADTYFDQSDDDGTVIVLRDAVQPQHKSDVEAAVNYCPVSALRISPDVQE